MGTENSDLLFRTTLQMMRVIIAVMLQQMMLHQKMLQQK